MKKTALFSVMILALAGALAAQPGPKMDGTGPRGVAGNCLNPALNLDDAQQKALQQVRLEHEKTMVPLQADMKVARMEYMEMISKGEDRKKIDKKQDEMNDIREKMNKERTDHLLKVRSIVGEDNFLLMHARMGRGGRGNGGFGGAGCGTMPGGGRGYRQR